MMKQVTHKMKVAVVAAAAAMLLSSSGCTTNATRQAIGGFRKTQAGQQQVVDESLRIANEQMHLNLVQYVQAHGGDQQKVVQAIDATWKARAALEELRVQYAYWRAWSEITVGQYLYNQQGAMNVIAEDLLADANRASRAADAANKATGVNGVTDLIPKPVLDAMAKSLAGPATAPADKH